MELDSDKVNGVFWYHYVTIMLPYTRKCFLTAVVPCLVRVLFHLFEISLCKRNSMSVRHVTKPMYVWPLQANLCPNSVPSWVQPITKVWLVRWHNGALSGGKRILLNNNINTDHSMQRHKLDISSEVILYFRMCGWGENLDLRQMN
jgi:hypothetical protein